MPVLLKNGRVEEDSFRGGVTHGYDGTPHEVANSELAVQRAVVGSGERNGGSETDRVTIKEWHPNEQPRERLLELGPQALSDAELIAILLRTGTPDKDVLQLSRELLRTFGSGIGGDRLIDIAGRDIRELQQVRGIGPTKAITLAAAFELGSRVASRSFSESPVMKEPKDIARFFIPRMRALRKEQFHVIVQNTAGQIIRTELVSEGNLNSSIVTPREVYRAAIIENAASIIGLHNHPSGNPKPSFEDIAVTRQLVEAGRILQIPFHDHIIIAGEEYVSMLDEGLM
ncbi:MAG: DNA repair protein RadC [Candidatus Andersenbacteria bacterium]|nr:DNA repair protein RadC [Candidatus Andersenbacteria bacterium]